MRPEIVKKDVKGFKNAWLLKKGDKYFLLVAGENKHIGETLVFKSNKSGQIKDWKKECTFVNIGLNEAANKFGDA